MSKKYLISQASTGFSKEKVKSKFGAKILEKLGWKEGDGLGKKRDGMTECIQIQKRDENLGLGANVERENWKNQWWEDMYNDIVTKVDVKPNKVEDNNDESEDEGSTSSSDEEIIVVSSKKTKEIPKNNLLNKKRKKQKD